MITPNMIEAGAAALKECKEGLDEGEKARIVFEAMTAAATVVEPEVPAEPVPEPTPVPDKTKDAEWIMANQDRYTAEQIKWARGILGLPDGEASTPVPTGIVITTQAEFDAALAKGGAISLGKGEFSLNVKGSGITITATPETIFKTGGSVSGANVTIKGGKVVGKPAMANGVPLLKVENSDGLTLDGVEFAGGDNSGVAIFGRNVKNLKVINSHIHNVRDGVMIWSGSNIVVEDNLFSQMGSDCFDPSGVDGVYFRRNKIRDARHMASAHPDIVQLGTAPCKNVYIEDNDSEADTMGYDDFGCTGPNINVNVRRNKIKTVGYENTIRFLVAGTTGEVVDNEIIKGGTKNPLFTVPTTMKKSGNTIDGKPV